MKLPFNISFKAANKKRTVSSLITQLCTGSSFKTMPSSSDKGNGPIITDLSFLFHPDSQKLSLIGISIEKMFQQILKAKRIDAEM